MYVVYRVRVEATNVQNCHSSRSDKSADGHEGSTRGSDCAKASEALVDSHDGLLVEVAVVLDFTVDHVGEETLHSKVHLVLPEVVGRLTHEEVGPAGVADSVQVLVVLDRVEALLQDLCVQHRVQGVLRH